MSWHLWLSDKTVRKFEELPIYCQQENCSPWNLVPSKVRFIWIFQGVCWRGASNECGVIVNGDFRFFRSLYLPNHHIHGHNYYTVLCSPLVALHWHRNGWPWMTLNGYFALKSGSSSPSNGLAFWLSEKPVRRFAELRIDCQRQKMKPPLYWWYKVFAGVPLRGSIKPVNCIHTQFSDVLFTDIENK